MTMTNQAAQPNDHKKPKLTRNEQVIYELVMALQSLEKRINSLHRMLAGVIAVTNPDIGELVKTVRNDMRIGSVLSQIEKAEKDIIMAEATKATEEKKESDEASSFGVASV